MGHPRHHPEPVLRSWQVGLSWLFGVLVLATVVLVATQFTAIERFAEIARDAQPVWLLAAFVLQALTYACAAGVWYVPLRRGGVRKSYWSIVPLGLAKLFTDQALPTGGIGGTLLVVSGLDRRGVPNGIGMAALLIGLVSYYLAYLIAVLTALAILYGSDSLDRPMIAAAMVFVLVAFGIPAIVFAIRHWSRRKDTDGPLASANKWLSRIPGFPALMSAMSEAPSRIAARSAVVRRGAGAADPGVRAGCRTLWVMLAGARGRSTAHDCSGGVRHGVAGGDHRADAARPRHVRGRVASPSSMSRACRWRSR